MKIVTPYFSKEKERELIYFSKIFRFKFFHDNYKYQCSSLGTNNFKYVPH